MTRLTGIIHTRNEERNLARALRSLTGFCDEVVVADMHSEDRTVPIAESLGARVISVPNAGYVEPVRAMAEDAAQGEWIIRIDADEVVPRTLALKLRQIVDENVVDAVLIGRRNFMFGNVLKGTGWAPSTDTHWFLFRRGALEPWQANDGIHSGPRPQAGARLLELEHDEGLCVWHFNYTDWSHFMSKLDRYTSIEAQELIQKGVRPTWRLLMRGILREVVRRGIEGRCWRDGSTGVGLLWMQMTYRMMVFQKMRQMKSVGDVENIIARYDALAAGVVDDLAGSD